MMNLNLEMLVSENMVRSTEEMISKVVMLCGDEYGFDGEEALRKLGIRVVVRVKKSENVKRVVKSKESKSKELLMPYSGEYDVLCCEALRRSHGLYTQCKKSPEEKGTLCKTCSLEYGSIIDRKKAYDSFEIFKDPSGKSPVAYTKVMKLLKISKEAALLSAEEQGISIDPVHFEEVIGKKSGRPRKNDKKEKGEPKPKGRPKKSKKGLELEGEEDALFETLVKGSKADEIEMKDMMEDIIEEMIDSSIEVEVEVEEEPKVEVEVEVKPSVRVAAVEVEKLIGGKKVSKEDKKAAKEAEKEAKKAAKEAEKEAKKAAKKVSKKVAKVEEKVVEEPEEEVEEPEEEADVVKRFTFEDKKYLKSTKTNIVYNMDQEAIGKWNEAKKRIEFDEIEEEQEEEYDEEDDN
jgi:hypothetical protein